MRSATILCAAFYISNFLSFLGACLWYATTRPIKPNVTVGRMYPFHEKGAATVYLTASETTGLSLLALECVGGFALAAFAMTREPRERTLMGTVKEAVFTKRNHFTLWSAVAGYVAIVILLGPSITSFAVSHGVLLDFGSFG